MSPPPQLTFACELDAARLAELFADSAVIDDLLALGARVALMCSDFSDERAGVVRRLNAAGVPVAGIPLLPLAEGYYFTVDNADRAAGSYREFKAWTRRLRSFEWIDVDGPPDGARTAAALRKSLRAALWASAHPRLVLGVAAASAWLAWRWRRR